MRDLDKLLLSAFPQELTDTPPAPVEKRRIKEQTFQKLNLELSGGAASVAGEQWAVPVAKKRRPWAVLAACLALAVVAGLGVALRPLLVPGVAPLTQGTYLNLEVTETHFRQETGELVFTLEATTDLSLNAQTKSQSYGWWVGASFSTHVGNTILRGGQEALTKLTRWQQVGEDTYRCEGFALELLSQTRSEQELYGEQEGVFSMEVTDSSGKTLNASAPFAVELPPDGPTTTFETSYPVGTYLEGSVINASFDREQWAVILNLHAQTDMELSDPSAETRYQWEYRLVFHTSQGDQQVAGSQDLFHDSQLRWKTGGDYYETTMTIPVDPEFLREKNLVGSQEGTLFLQVTDNSAGEEDPPQFSVDLDFSMTLPWSATQLTSGTEPVGTYFDCSVTEAAFDRQKWAILLTLEARTDLELSDPAATTSTRYQWTETPKLHTPEGDQWVSKENRVSNITPLAYWESLGDSAYRVTLEYPVDPQVQEESSLVGEFPGTLSLNVRDGSAGLEEDPQVFSAQMDFTVTLPDQSQAEPPDPGTYLQSDWEISPSYEEGVLAMRPTVRTDMDLDNPLAQRYYQWTGGLTLTGGDGRRVTLAQAENPPMEWQYASAATSYLYTEDDGYRTVDPLNFGLSNQEYPTEEELRAAYRLEGQVEGSLTLTCEETVESSTSPRTWSVTIPVVVELPSEGNGA